MQIHYHGSKWAGDDPDPIDVLFETLKTCTLDPTFESYGNFVLPTDSEGLVIVWGNFADISHVFCIDGTDEEMQPVISAIRANQQTDRYIAERKRRMPAKRKRSKAVQS